MPPRPRTALKAASSAISAEEEFKTFDQYTAEADLPPFVLPYGDGQSLVFECPDGNALRQIEVAQRNGNFDLLCHSAFGEKYEELWDLAGDKPFPVIRSILQDLLDHFQRGLVTLGE